MTNLSGGGTITAPRERGTMYQLHHGDCVDVMSLMPDCSIDLTVTSPPYDDMRTYNGTLDWNHGVFCSVADQLYRVTKDGGVVVWVVGDATRGGSESGNSFRQALYFMSLGFNLHDTMIYEKAQSCFGSNNGYLQAFEYMFVLSKGMPKEIHLIRDRKNARSGTESMAGGGLSKDGTKAERVRKALSEFGRRKNIWKYGVGGGKTGHPAVFPEALATDHILSWSAESDTVLDPFMGSGTTGVACAKTGRNFVGIEKERGYFEISDRRVSEAHQEPKQKSLF